MVPPPKHRKPRKPKVITRDTDFRKRVVEIVTIDGQTFARTKRLKFH